MSIISGKLLDCTLEIDTPLMTIKNLLFVFIAAGLTSGIFSSCSKQPTQYEKDIQLIRDYLSENNLAADSTPNGVYYIIDTTGNGTFPNSSSTVKAIYRGYLLDGSEFDSSNGSAIEFSLNQVIQGWKEGIPKFDEGASGMLLIPSLYGYGTQSVGSIPPNSVLIFDITLVDVVQ